MLLCLVHTFSPNRASSFGTTQLSCKYQIERINLLLSPFYTCTHHKGRETRLKIEHAVSNDGEINKGHFPDILMKIALEYTLSVLKLVTAQNAKPVGLP